MTAIVIRPATPQDAELIYHFVRELAIYERAEHEVVTDVQGIRDSIFGAESTVSALICLVDDKPAGFAVYFFNYSTWLGRRGLFLEDLYVSPELRGVGAGKALLRHLAQEAVSKGCGRFEWNVLDWNTPAIEFYESIGARPQSEWTGYRLTGKALTDFAGSTR